MRFTLASPALIFSLPLLALAAPNGSDEPATSTQYATETHTITHTQLRATLTSTYSPSLSYFPLVAATDAVSGPFPDIPNPTLTGSGAATQILVALLPSTSSSTVKSRTTVVRPSGTGARTVTTPLVLASATNLATASPTIAPYTGAAAAGMRGWSSGVALVCAAVGFAAGLL